MTTIGSLCTGYGGLDLGLQAVAGGTVAWHAELDPDASRVLEARHPTVPNLGDLTVIDWATVPPVNWLSAGYPCQPFSTAGRRKGADDDRHLWPHIAHAVSVLRPGHVLLENVAGHLSLGFDTVLGDLAALGYDATWRVVRAADVGAPHRRERLFVVATDADNIRSDRGWLHGPRERWGPQPSRRSELTADAPGNRQDERWPEPAGQQRRHDAPISGANAPADTDEPRRQGAEPTAGRDLLARRTPADTDGAVGGQQLPGGVTPGPSQATVPETGRRAGRGSGASAWGTYERPIRQWELILERPAPAPTEPNRNGNQRLNPPFVEWMMGLPAGWVTDVPGVSRNAQLRILGNGVVPQQAAYAVRALACFAALP